MRPEVLSKTSDATKRTAMASTSSQVCWALSDMKKESDWQWQTHQNTNKNLNKMKIYLLSVFYFFVALFSYNICFHAHTTFCHYRCFNTNVSFFCSGFLFYFWCQNLTSVFQPHTFCVNDPTTCCLTALSGAVLCFSLALSKGEFRLLCRYNHIWYPQKESQPEPTC